MKKDNRKRKKLILDKIMGFHPQFLQAIKEVYPLAILSSFSIAISAFSQGKFISAQGYAIGAGISFLLAFAFSLLCRLAPSNEVLRIYAIPSYVSVGFGILFLMLVAADFAVTVFVVEIVFWLIFPTSTFIIMVTSVIWTASCITERSYAKIIMKKCNIESLPTSYSLALKLAFFVPTIICSTLMFSYLSYVTIYRLESYMDLVYKMTISCALFIALFYPLLLFVLIKKLKK